MDFIYVVTDLIIALGISAILNIIEFRKFEGKKFIYTSFAIFLISGNPNSNFGSLYQVLIIILIGIFNYLDNDKFIKGAITGGVALLLCNISSSLIYSFIDIDVMANSSLAKFILGIVTIIISIALAYLLRKICIVLKTYDIKDVSWKLISIILVVIVCGLSIYLMIIPRGSITGQSGEFITYYNGSTFVIYLIILIGIMYILGNKIKEEIIYKQKLKESENIKEYTKSLEDMYGDLRKFRHDYINIISSIIGYIDDEDIQGLKEHVYTNILPLEKNINRNNSKLHLLKNIKVSELKGLVSSKLIRAQELNINVNIDIMEEIEVVNVDIVTLCRIVGIFIDNGIEECENIDNSYLTFGIIKNKTTVDFIVSNSCRENIEPIYKLNLKGFSTKGNNRGLGLAILEELVEENENLILDTIIQNGSFTQILTVDSKKEGGI